MRSETRMSGDYYNSNSNPSFSDSIYYRNNYKKWDDKHYLETHFPNIPWSQPLGGICKQFANHLVRLTMKPHLFLEFWFVDAWFFADWRHYRDVTRLENVRQSSIRRGKKLGFQLSHKHPLTLQMLMLEEGIASFNLKWQMQQDLGSWR